MLHKCVQLYINPPLQSINVRSTSKLQSYPVVELFEVTLTCTYGSPLTSRGFTSEFRVWFNKASKGSLSLSEETFMTGSAVERGKWTVV